MILTRLIVYLNICQIIRRPCYLLAISGLFRQYVYSILGFFGGEEKNGAPTTRVREDGGVEVACASATPPGDALRR
jgi:hypothetical protein